MMELPKEDVHNQWGFVLWEHFPDKSEGRFQVLKSALFGAKSFGFYEICGVSAQTKRS